MVNHYHDITVGDVVAGKYHVIRTLGEGSFGKVYQVSDRKSNDMYALKILKMWDIPAHLHDKLRARFEMEYQTGCIDSPYVVHAYEYGSVNNNPYILMEYCPNGDLTRLSPDTDWNKIALQVLYGLKALHEEGKVHRDLKPENVLLKKDGTAALTDFGICGDRHRRMTVMGSDGKPMQKFGTYAFMPPEQLDPEKNEATVLPTTDIFSFGVMLFFLLVGELPFGALNTQNDLAMYIRRVKEGNWNSYAVAKTPFFEAISGCLVPNYRNRLQTVDDVIRLLPNHEDITQTTGVIPNNDETFAVQGYLLRIMQGEECGRTYDITSMLQKMKFLTVGRLDKFINNDIAIKEDCSSYISRQHCTILKESDGSYKIQDGQRDWSASNGWRRSTNGTYVNSSEASDKGFYLKVGDIITIGDVTMRFEAYR